MPMRRASGSTHAPGPGDRPPADPHAARVGALEAGDHPQQRRLARAARAEHREEAAALEPQVDAVDGAPPVEAAREPVRLDRRLAAPSGGIGSSSMSGASSIGGNSDGSGEAKGEAPSRWRAERDRIRLP